MRMIGEININPKNINEIDYIDNNSIVNKNFNIMKYIFNNISNGVLVIDENNIINLLNKQAENIFGVLSENVAGKFLEKCIPNSRLHLINGESSVYILKKDSKELVLLRKISPICLDGIFKGNVIIFEDISKIKQMNEELIATKKIRDKFEIILNSIKEGICFLDKDGYISYVNSEYLNISEEDKNILGKHINEVSPNGIRKKVFLTGKSYIEKVKNKQKNIISSTYPIIRDNNIIGILSTVNKVRGISILSENSCDISENEEVLEENLNIINKPHKAFDKFIGHSQKIIEILLLATKAAKSSATVLIRGESGTGKELIAEGIHYASERDKGPFIRVNCAAIPENLIESELFGHEKGSFTGAIKRKLGKFELAQNGTIFLDEIGEMDKNTQAKILRVLQYKEFQRVGGEETIKVDVRVIAATHRNLEEMIKKSEFREDLYYRLNVIPIFIPELKDRVEDIPILVKHFINKFQKDNKHKQVSKDVMNTFINYSWNGNVRELENVIERILALNESNIITLKDIPLYIKEKTLKSSKSNIKIFKDEDIISYQRGEILNVIENVEEVLPMKVYERMIIEKALRKYGSFNAAGKALGLNHKTIAAKAKEFGLEKTTYWKKRTI
ncbi:sigma 54-interacting transcriptional regulator [Clostridium weizhouense]|uniref:HTH-type transcriptional regulatory protein TyrR n=1 Tax=Clostridium weizhouense TaxID=2859781 RepID=A0ABS7AR07_9CLOT|nr:sigma 54-interacting transcriptional regulator [Clostridium weizhouense]MBW6411099.1 sigma 54-interacting transcriptional regulator [Clostridium weizhouense]